MRDTRTGTYPVDKIVKDLTNSGKVLCFLLLLLTGLADFVVKDIACGQSSITEPNSNNVEKLELLAQFLHYIDNSLQLHMLGNKEHM